jgi:hypothetical protein
MSEQPLRGAADLERPQVLALYLPQFHQVPENDAWHGRGFTEWTVVAQGKPLYPGHRQPDLPGELGFYDLRVPETRYRQARLARDHGITGFVYHHYWFSGKRMLGRPLDEVLASGRPDFPFALCWANESWFRRWQGATDEMLVEQEFSEEDDLEHIKWLIGCFKDPRYIRIAGRPLLAVGRAQLLPDPIRTAELWSRECAASGVEPPWLVMFETSDDTRAPEEYGFDAGAESVPHRLPALLDDSSGTNRGPHAVFDYDDVASAYLNRPPADWLRYPCVATGWDNSPRGQTDETLMLRNATPEGYGRWLTEAVSRQAKAAGRDGIVFVNSWNGWAEGAHLEPDAWSGRAHLETTRDVLRALFGDDGGALAAVAPDDASTTSAEDLYHQLYDRFVALQAQQSGLLSYSDRKMTEWRNHYEGLLAQSRDETRAVADLNQEMTEELEFLAGRLRALGEDVPPMPWLVTP